MPAIFPGVESECELLLTYRQLARDSTALHEIPGLQKRLSALSKSPRLFQYLGNDPADVPVHEWVPRSSTVITITTCFLAMDVIAHRDPSLTIWTQRALAAFLPRAFRWLPYLHPAYSNLRPHPYHIGVLVHILPVMYRHATRTWSFRERSATLNRYLLSLWIHVVTHLDPDSWDAPHDGGTSDLDHLHLLGDCVLDMLSPKDALAGRPERSHLCATLREEFLLVTKGKPRRALAGFLRTVTGLFGHATASLEHRPLHVHIRVITALVENIVPETCHSRDILRLSVDLSRQTRRTDAVEAACHLLLALWTTARNNDPLVWSLQRGLIHVLRPDHRDSVVVESARLAIHRYVAARTTSRGILLALMAERLPLSVLTEGFSGDVSVMREVEVLLERRLQMISFAGGRTCSMKLCRKAMTSTQIYCCNIKSPFDTAFAALQALEYMHSARGCNLLEDLVRIEEACRALEGPDEVNVELLLDRLPPQHTITLKTPAGSPPTKTILIMKARLFLHKPSVVTIVLEPKSLSSFLGAFNLNIGCKT
ncbi:uncharacterized protein SCHCODRAFT_02672464 [Schizophyllum commune H4-8]|nr:uncharacterized protein SCHCODRAFT_02672464 [Schizophyllum commune H4-8]KAI5887343.1 hypothetical protein SCHCODRAFT_02672464 [Schizophyllum commune H4-8]